MILDAEGHALANLGHPALGGGFGENREHYRIHLRILTGKLSGSGLPEPTIHALHPLLGSRRYTIGKLGRSDEVQTMVVTWAHLARACDHLNFLSAPTHCVEAITNHVWRFVNNLHKGLLRLNF
jgi:hypothetical protein